MRLAPSGCLFAPRSRLELQPRINGPLFICLFFVCLFARVRRPRYSPGRVAYDARMRDVERVAKEPLLPLPEGSAGPGALLPTFSL